MSANPFLTLKTALDADPTKTYPEARELFNALAFMLQFQTGTVTTPGGATPLDVDIEGNPRFVVVFNDTTATMVLKIYGMADANAAKKVTGGALTYTDETITLGTGKFTIGADADINSGDAVTWCALV